MLPISSVIGLFVCQVLTTGVLSWAIITGDPFPIFLSSCIYGVAAFMVLSGFRARKTGGDWVVNFFIGLALAPVLGPLSLCLSATIRNDVKQGLQELVREQANITASRYIQEENRERLSQDIKENYKYLSEELGAVYALTLVDVLVEIYEQSIRLLYLDCLHDLAIKSVLNEDGTVNLTQLSGEQFIEYIPKEVEDDDTLEIEIPLYHQEGVEEAFRELKHLARERSFWIRVRGSLDPKKKKDILQALKAEAVI
jgi:hypothetical protein